MRHNNSYDIFHFTKPTGWKGEYHVTDSECTVCNVTLEKGVNCKLSQETTEMKTRASLISLKLIGLPVKCHLSPCDWDRKPNTAICHKHPFGILKKYIFEVSLLLIIILFHQPTHLHMGKHTHKDTNTHTNTSSIFEGLHSPFSALNNSLDCRLLHIFPFQKNWGIFKWFVFIFPFFLRIKA